MEKIDKINEEIVNNIYDENICKLLITLKEKILNDLNKIEESCKNSRDFYIFTALIFSLLSILLFLVVHGFLLGYILFIVFIFVSNYLKYIKDTYYKKETLKMIDKEKLLSDIDNLNSYLQLIKNKIINLQEVKKDLEKNSIEKKLELPLMESLEIKPKRKVLQ